MFLSIIYGGKKVLFAVEENNEDTYPVSGISETMTGATIPSKPTLLVATINHSCLSSYCIDPQSQEEEDKRVLRLTWNSVQEINNT